MELKPGQVSLRHGGPPWGGCLDTGGWDGAEAGQRGSPEEKEDEGRAWE